MSKGTLAATNGDLLAPYFERLASCGNLHWTGRVTQAVGQVVESEGPCCSLGEACEIEDQHGRRFEAEVIGFRGRTVLSMPVAKPDGIRFGDLIITGGHRPSIPVGPALLGRVLDASGQPLDGGATPRARARRAYDANAPLPMARELIREPLGCGVRAIDGFVTCGRGQRVGIFGGSGVGKSTLIGMMARGTSADLTVLALVGERGREVKEFLDEALGAEGRRRSVVVVSTSDQSPLLRLRAALAATSIAEYFCGLGQNVLLVVDSLTRFAMAQREIGLAAGEPPTAKGYTPSVFSLLARLIERAGRFGEGSITAFYSVLMEGDDQQDPLVDAVRSLLDGHVVLDRSLAAQGHYPPINVLDSLSRLMPSICSREQMEKVAQLKKLLAHYARSEDLIRIGAYQKGADPLLDRALALRPAILEYLQQKKEEAAPLAENVKRLRALPSA
ncbi:MAG TPA: FliI/YscN family ATPase [Terriglobales bacterium]|nr:FliI/YscN family ATPase [Terriglobales bacterium]